MPIIMAQAEPAAAISSIQAPNVVSAPSWDLQPDFTDFVNAFPLKAGVSYREGHATILCTVSAAGRLTNCLVVSEDPAGEGFGDAALRLSLLYKMKPVAKDGRPTSGGMIRVPMRFQRPPPAPVSTAVPPIKVAAADWGRIPDAKDLARAYPPAALGAHLEGLGVMRCTFTATGDLRDCAVMSESPTGYGFGDAALKLAKDFRLKSPVHDGIPVAGATIDIPLRFRLPG